MTSALERPAARLLLWCARTLVSANGHVLPALDTFDDPEWAWFIATAARHACLPIAWRAMAGIAGVPDEVANELRTASDANALHSLRLAGELITATRALAAAGVSSVSWKGPLLAERAYGDLRLRQFFDLDMLVRPADLQRAVETLESLGFRPQHALPRARQLAYVEHMGELELVRESDGLWLELHTAIVPTYFGRGRGADDLWLRVQTTRLARAAVDALEPADELEALCLHGAKHLWDRLEWIVDIGMLGRLLDDDDWARLALGAGRRRTLRMVRVGLLLAASTCAASFPDSVMTAARGDPVARRLAAMARRGLFAPRLGRSSELRFHVQMWDSTADRARYLTRLVLTPSVADWQFVDLPPSLSALYRLVRPLRMARHALARRARDGADTPLD